MRYVSEGRDITQIRNILRFREERYLGGGRRGRRGRGAWRVADCGGRVGLGGGGCGGGGRDCGFRGGVVRRQHDLPDVLLLLLGLDQLVPVSVQVLHAVREGGLNDSIAY